MNEKYQHSCSATQPWHSHEYSHRTIHCNCGATLHDCSSQLQWVADRSEQYVAVRPQGTHTKRFLQRAIGFNACTSNFCLQTKLKWFCPRNIKMIYFAWSWQSGVPWGKMYWQCTWFAGFLVDSAKHMWPDDMSALYEDMTLPDGRQPLICHEVRITNSDKRLWNNVKSSIKNKI